MATAVEPTPGPGPADDVLDVQHTACYVVVGGPGGVGRHAVAPGPGGGQPRGTVTPPTGNNAAASDSPNGRSSDVTARCFWAAACLALACAAAGRSDEPRVVREKIEWLDVWVPDFPKRVLRGREP
jgi:hypothetical protein